MGDVVEIERPRRETVLVEDPGALKPYVHQFMPNLAPDAYDALKEDIRENGVLMPLLVDEERAIVDGHNRVRIWSELLAEGDQVGPVAAHVIRGLDAHHAHQMAIAMNVKRRNMTPPQKRELVAQELRYLAHYYAEQGFAGEETRSWDTRRVARHLAVSAQLVLEVRRKLEEEGEIPVARKLVRVKRTKSGGHSEQVFEREGLQKQTERFSSSKDAQDGKKKGPAKVKVGNKMLTPGEVRELVAEQAQAVAALEAEREEEKAEYLKRIDAEFVEEMARVKARYGDEEEPTFAEVGPEAWAQALKGAKSQRVMDVTRLLGEVYGWPEWMGQYFPDEAAEAVADMERRDSVVEGLRFAHRWVGQVLDAIEEREGER